MLERNFCVTISNKAAILVLIATLFSGCATSPPDNIPIRARPSFLNIPEPWIVTFFGVIYVPPGSLDFYTKEPVSIVARAVLEHERTHARRQYAAGMLDWHERYATDRDFRWSEERKAYEVEIAFLRANNFGVDKSYYVSAVINPIYCGMVSKADAETWIESLLNRLGR